MRPFVESRGVQELSGLSATTACLQIKRHAAFNDDAVNLHLKTEIIVTVLQQRHAWPSVAHPHLWHSVQSRRELLWGRANHKGLYRICCQ